MRPLPLLLALVLATSAEAKEILPFVHDDYTAAVAHAKAKNVPLFVEAWAPW